MKGSTSAGFVWGGAVVIDAGGAAFLAAWLVRKWEGLSLVPYLCPAGKWTIGYGHVILPHEQYLMAGITESEAESLLLRDLAWALFAARNVGRVLSDGQVAALASLIINIGLYAWIESTIRRLVMAGDMAGAGREFARWNKVAGQVSAGLVNRRAEEAAIFSRG